MKPVKLVHLVNIEKIVRVSAMFAFNPEHQSGLKLGHVLHLSF